MAKQEDSVRLFYALWPDAAARAEFRRLQENLRGRLTRYENFHITLSFLGQQPSSLVPALKDILARLPTGSMMLTIDRLGYFTRNRIAWAGMHAPPDALLQLHGSLTQLLMQEGVSVDAPSSFRPHVTLARDAAPPSDMVFDPISWKADQVALIQSDMQREGVIYRVLASRSLDEDARTPDEAGRNILNTEE
ncbi:MAG: thpR [Noviherbaspirillum sp.]|jgi:2'-5' RNA ligase|nr:thpR [Noviherbaspirillum sp.]